jgi:cytochrome c-type biogenesis protein CcmF
MEARGVFGLVSREAGLVLNNVLLSVAALVVFVGTIWPLVAEMLLGRTLSVGAPFFDAAFTPFMVAIAVALPLGSLLAWKRGDLGRSLRTLWPALLLAFAVAGLAWTVGTGRSMLAILGAALGTWVMAGAALDLWQRTGRSGVMRLLRLPGADWGKALAHGGLGVTILGIALHLAWSQEDIRVAQVGESFEVGAYSLTLNAVDMVDGTTYRSEMADVTVARGGSEVARLHPEKRFYYVAGMPTTEAAIDNGFWRDVYVVIGDPQDNGGYAVRTYIKPFSNWIWGGAIIMALGGLVSLGDRRLRVAGGAAKPARNPDAVPAE